MIAVEPVSWHTAGVRLANTTGCDDPPPSADTVKMPPPLNTGDEGEATKFVIAWFARNSAPTLRSTSSVTATGVVVPLASPDQPLKVEFAPGCASSASSEFVGTGCEHEPELHDAPLGATPMLPLPAPLVPRVRQRTSTVTLVGCVPGVSVSPSV